MASIEELEKQIKSILTGNWAILGIGNILRGDDAFGSLIAQELKPLAPDRIFDGGIAPENFYGKIAKLGIENLLIIDSVVFDGKPGELRVFALEELASPLPMTHGPTNFTLLEKFLPCVRVCILAVNPNNTRIGHEISEEVKQACRKAEIIIKNAITNL